MSQGFDSQATGQDNFGNWEVEPDLPKSKGGGCLKGCLIATVVLLLLTVLGGWYASNNWRGWAGSLGRTMVNGVLDETELPAEEKTEILEQVQRVINAFEEGSLTSAQAEDLSTQLTESPLSAPVIAFVIEKKYFDRSGLSDEEKETGRMTLRRCVRGLFDGELTEDDADAVLSHIGTKDSEGNWEFRDDVTDDKLREFLAEAKERADNAGVAETVEEVDPSDEIKRIVDSVLNPELVEAEVEETPMPES
jgi:hypothetical protein